MHVSTESLFAGQPNKCCMIWCQVGDYDHESVAKVPAICPTVSLQKKHQAKNSLQSDWAAPVNWRCLGRNITIVPTLGMRWASWKWRYLAGGLSSIAQKLPKLFAIEPDVLKITSKSAFRTSWMLWLFLDPDKKTTTEFAQELIGQKHAGWNYMSADLAESRSETFLRRSWWHLSISDASSKMQS